MQQIENRILNQLLDRYENSKLSRHENMRMIHISYAFRKSTLPQYFDESSYMTDEINLCMQELQRQGILEIQWKNGKIGFVIDKVVLCNNAVDVVYRKLGRMSKMTAEKNVDMLLKNLHEQVSGTATRAFIEKMLAKIEDGRSVKEYMDIRNLEQVRKLINALNWIENNQRECYIREFSIEHFHDSKLFEQMIPKICRIIREEYEEFSEFENEEILAEYYIYKNPGYVYVKGDAKLVAVDGKTIDIGVLPEGIGFAVGQEKELMVKIIPNDKTKEVYTIENLTSFYRFQKANSLIVYLGGYHNKVRQQLLLQIYQNLPDAQYYHFGDIDIGGFQIFYHLREKTGIPFQTYKMDIQTIQKYEQYSKPLTENDRKRLVKLMETNFAEPEKYLAKYMLEHNIKLEQECIWD